MEDLSTGYTWDEAPENLKKVALHLSNVLKIDKTEAYQMILEKMTELCRRKLMELSKEQMEKVIEELETSYNSKIFDDENLIIIINLFKNYLNKGES